MRTAIVSLPRLFTLAYLFIGTAKILYSLPCIFYGTFIQKLKMNEQETFGIEHWTFLKKELIFEEAQAQAVKEVVAWQLAKAMKKKKISKARMAVLLKTSRSQVDRILDPKRDITLSSLQRAAALVGQRVVIELI